MTTRTVTARRRYRTAAEEDASESAEMEPLSAAQIRELRRRVADLEDRTRYLIASVFIPRSFVLYYDIAGDTFLMNDPTGATLFKRERTALTVMELLGSNCRLMKCRITKRGKLVKSSVIAMPHVRRARSITTLGD